MSNGNGGANCAETFNVKGDYYIFKAPEYELGPIAVLSEVEYKSRLQLATEGSIQWPGGEVTPNADAMFGDQGRPAELSDGEVYAYGKTIAAGLVDYVPEGESVIAHENMSHLGEPNPYAGPVVLAS